MEHAVAPPSFLPAARPFDEAEVVGRLRALSASLRARLHAGLTSEDAQVVIGYDNGARDAAHALALALSSEASAAASFLRPDWLAPVRDAFGALADAYWSLLDNEGVVDSDALRLRAACAIAFQVQWSLCDRHAPPLLAWIRLGELFCADHEEVAGEVTGDLAGVPREFLRAVALFTAGIDQLPLAEALAVNAAIGAALPFLALGHEPVDGVHYFVDPPDVYVPQRRVSLTGGRSGWIFHPALASEFLDELALLLSLGRTPRGFEGVDCAAAIAAVRRLKALWCVRPPRRRDHRYPVDGELAVICGFSGARSALSSRAAVASANWRITDLSRNGLGMSIPFEPSRPIPDNGELLGVRTSDGENWRIGVTRRVRYDRGGIAVGIETLCLNPVLLSVTFAEGVADVIACDPIRSGRAVRIALPPDISIGEEALLTGVEHGSVRLMPLAGMTRGYDFDLRNYRVL